MDGNTIFLCIRLIKDTLEKYRPMQTMVQTKRTGVKYLEDHRDPDTNGKSSFG